MAFKKVISLFKNRKFKVTTCIALFLTSVLIIMAMLLGNEAGTFVIRVHDGDVEQSIILSDNEDFTNPAHQYATLSAPGMTNMDCWTPEFGLFDNDGYADSGLLYDLTSIPGLVDINKPEYIEIIEEYRANNPDQNLDLSQIYCYTFYIVNTTRVGASGFYVDIEMSFDSSKTREHLDEGVRIMTYSPQATDRMHIYQKPDEYVSAEVQAKRKDYQSKCYYPVGVNEFDVNDEFVFGNSDKSTAERIFMNSNTYSKTEYIKYSVLFWIEGWDYDTERFQMYNGTFQFSLDVSIASSASN